MNELMKNYFKELSEKQAHEGLFYLISKYDYEVQYANEKNYRYLLKYSYEVLEAIKWVAFTLLGIGVFILVLVMGLKAFADGKMYNAPKDYTYQQKVWQGKIEPKKYTTCRLKKRLTSKFTNKKACIYEGNNKTYTMMIEVFCPRQFKCEYKTLNSKMPDIDKVLDSLRSIKD